MKMSQRPLFFLSALLIAATLMASDKKDEGAQSSLSFLVLKDDTGKPVRQCGGCVASGGTAWQQAKGGFELKTDNEGKSHFDGIPYGTLRVQVIAPGSRHSATTTTSIRRCKRLRFA